MVSKFVFIILAIVWVAVLCALPQTPPMPQTQAMQELGRQSPYISTVSLIVTQTVTTVSELTFLRTIRVQVGSNMTYKTNFLLMDTNVISVTTNESNRTP